MRHLFQTADGRIRAGWRILLYFALFVLLFTVGGYATSVLPRSPLGWVNYLVLTAAGLLAGWVLLIRLDGRLPGALGFAVHRATPRELLTGFAVGAVLIGAASLLLFVSGTARFEPDEGDAAAYVGSLTWTLVYFALAAAYEELLFRGYPFQALVEGVGVVPAVIGSSALFAIAHGQNPGVTPIAFANIFLAGVLLAVAYLRTRSLWFATMLHAGWNWTTASAIGFPVSGLVLLDTPLYDAVETGADWWTGGAFGPEAGLAATGVLLAGIVWLHRTRWVAEAPEMRALRPLVDAHLPEPR